MTKHEDKLRLREARSVPAPTISHEKAREAFFRMHNALYNHAEIPHLHVPPDPERDPDTILCDYIRQQEASSVPADSPKTLDEEFLTWAREQAVLVHHGQFHQWKDFEKCTEKNCVVAREWLARARQGSQPKEGK